MEFSSPLAAMCPQPCPMWTTYKDMPPRSPFRKNCQTYSAGNFDFKTMSMHQQNNASLGQKDYFTLRPVRGSSPTSSLTADLDANFHIDKSPQAPTPRRSLFTSDIFKPRENMGLLNICTPPIDIAGAMTPEIIPSSSPALDAMDISPLPHKAPYFVAKVTLPSPTPDDTPIDDFLSPHLLSPTSTVPPQYFAVRSPTLLPLPESQRPATRPSLSRTKGFTTTSTPQRPQSAETQLPPFRFGNVASLHSRPSSSSTPPLLESFPESSPSDEATPTALSMLPPPRRPSLSTVNRVNGSPSTGHVRKLSTGRPPFVRPQRKLMRRSLSMFQHPDDVMREEQNETFEPQASLSSTMDVETSYSPKLPHFVPLDEPDSLPRISQETMVDVLNSKYNSEFQHIMIIDCRFEYEYNGGHIEGAVNFNDKQLLAQELFNGNLPPSSTLLIFHCEYSAHRAPLTAKYVRNHDRTVNVTHYPKLSFPELYILDGGYSKFFASHRSKCFPQNYVEMNDQRHEQACERGMAKVKQRQKLFRNQTFAFGETHDEMDSSPTAPVRGMGLRSQSTFSVSEPLAECLGQSFQRRMASY